MTAASVLLAVEFTADTLRLLMAQPDGAPLIRDAFPLPPLPDEDAWSWEVGGRIAALFAREGQRRSALGIGVAAPGPVDPVAGRLLRSDGQPGWDGLAVVDALRRHIDAPIACESHSVAALLGERWQGAAAAAASALYVSLSGVPSAAALVGGRPLRGAHHDAGALPAVPELGADAPGERVEEAAAAIADATALLDPEVVILDAAPANLQRLLPLLQGVVDEIAPGPTVVASMLGEEAALLGAVQIAGSLAYEGERAQ